MHNYLITAATVLMSSLWISPDRLDPNISSTSADIKIDKTVQIVRVIKPQFSAVICNFSVTPGQSSPPSVILAGKVVSDNSGGAEEFVSVFFGSTLHLPRLAALTNVAGEFRFRVWLLDKPYDKRIEEQNRKLLSGSGYTQWSMYSKLMALSLREATVYLGGKFDANAEMVSSYTHIYPLGPFLERSAKKKSQDAEQAVKSNPVIGQRGDTQEHSHE